MKNVNNIIYTLTKKQLECLLVVALAETRFVAPNYKDLKYVVSTTCDAGDTEKLRRTVQNLEKIGFVKTRRIKISHWKNLRNTFHITDIGRDYLTTRVLSRARS